MLSDWVISVARSEGELLPRCCHGSLRRLLFQCLKLMVYVFTVGVVLPFENLVDVNEVLR